MVANVSPLNVIQNNSGTHPSSNASSGSGGPSFASMLNSEMQSTTPATPAQPVAPSQPASSANNTAAATNTNTSSTPAAATPGTTNPATGGTKTSGSGSGSGSGSASAASGSAAQNGKKTGKTDQAQTDAQSSAAQAAAAAAATAATAAALAAAASNPDLKTAAESTSTADAASAVIATTASTPTSASSTGTGTVANDQFSALASSMVPNAVPGQARDTASKPQLNVAPATTTDKTTATPVITQNAVTSTTASLPGSFGKSSMQAPPELSAAPNKNGNPESGSPKIAPDSVVPTTPAAGSATLAAVTAPIAPNLATPLPIQKPAGQELSIQQQNAIAPVLSMPANLDATTPTSTIAPQVGSPAWDLAVGQKINWMVNAGQQTASLTLNPPNLGPMQVVLSLNNQHVSATFISHQPEVRAALESAIPKLREMMGQSGIQLGDCNVNSQAQQQAFAQQQSNKGAGSGNSPINGLSGNIGVMPSESTIISKAGTGLVDTFV